MSRNKLPPGCAINWSKEPGKFIRLLDWFDAHPIERQILFSSQHEKSKSSSKTECAIKAARAIFSVDENSHNRICVLQDAGPFAAAILCQIRKGLTKKYQAFNKAIGADAAKMSYDDLQAGSGARRKVDKLSDKFPFWRRLHVYWRTLPQFNQFWPKLKPSQNVHKRMKSIGPSASGARKLKNVYVKKPSVAKPTRQTRSLSVDSDEVIVVEDSPTPNEISEAEDEWSHNNVRIRRSARNLKRSRDEFEDSNRDIPAKGNGKSFSAKADLGAVHRHELRMAEIQLKRQKLALEAQEKKTAAEIRRLELEAEERRRADAREREKERHDVIMRFMGLDTSKGK